jgi:multicomponent Na+:H+ antiporter subunit B
MSARVRMWMFMAAVAVFAWLFVRGITGLNPFGHYPGPYGDVVNRSVVGERQVTDAVTAVNFDYRGFDTLGEEFILFTSVMGVLLLLRRLSGEQKESKEPQPPSTSDALKVMTLVLTDLMVLFGLYIVAHGQLTPGGGFQGGVILATAPLLVFLIGGFKTFRNVTSPEWSHLAECAGAAAYSVIGLGAMLAGAAYLQNVLPYGSVGSVFSGGTIPLINAVTGLEVTSGFVLLLTSFLEETYIIRERGRR